MLECNQDSSNLGHKLHNNVSSSFSKRAKTNRKTKREQLFSLLAAKEHYQHCSVLVWRFFIEHRIKFWWVSISWSTAVMIYDWEWKDTGISVQGLTWDNAEAPQVFTRYSIHMQSFGLNALELWIIGLPEPNHILKYWNYSCKILIINH